MFCTVKWLASNVTSNVNISPGASWEAVRERFTVYSKNLAECKTHPSRCETEYHVCECVQELKMVVW